MTQYSIKDIAKLSGVSTATVSRVINNKGKYSEATREKVLKVIKKTGYIIDESAQSLRTNMTKTIGILVPDIKNHFFADLVQKIEEILFKKGYSTFICNTDRNSTKEKTYLKRLENKKVDAIIVISGSGMDGFKFESSLKQIPFVCIDREPQSINDTIFISSNHYQGALDATTYLLNHGVKHPLIVSNRISTSSNSRLTGFKEALRKNNIKFTKANNYLLLKKETDFISFIKKHPNIDGIFATDDNIAIKLLVKLKEIKKKIPDDIQVIGFDNIPIDQYIIPSLSTVAQNSDRIAKITVRNVLSSIKGQGEKGSKILIPTKLIIRKSTK